MMDDVFMYQHTFFAFFCACVVNLDFVLTSTSRELTIRALESKPHTFYHDSLLHRICFHFGIVKNAQGHAFKVASFLSMDIADHTTCFACTMRLIVHLGPLDCTHVRDLASTCHFHCYMHHDIYALCAASNSWITCSSHMFGCNIVITSHMPCPIDCYMLALIASHMMNNCSFHCVECHTIFTPPHAHYAWIVLHLNHVFRHFILFGVVNKSYAYHRSFIEQFVNACYDFEVDAYSVVTHICITTSHLHA